MKKIISLLMVMLVLACPISACKKKATVVASDLTIIVMDTTQALLPDVRVKAGNQVFVTSFDGRVVLKKEQVGKGSFTVSCDGYKEKTVSATTDDVLIVELSPKPGKKEKNEHEKYASGSVLMSRREAVLTKEAPMPSPGRVVEPMMVDYIEEVEDVALMDGASESSIKSVGAANNVSAGKLTAGEVNDFAKWYFWPRVMDGSHKAFVDLWRVVPRHRYTVQVTNKSGFPVVSRAVSLEDGQGNTLFQAVTDNTGKAELWYQLISNNLCGKHAGLKLRVDDQVQDAKDWSEGPNMFVVDEPCEAPDAVDVMFVFDATGSMGDELRYLQAEMRDVIARAKDATGGLAIRTGAVVYRDHGDEYITRISRLTDNITTTQQFIDKQEANGGGDYPEAVPEALMATMNSAGWDVSARARIAFLVLDAPCHQDSATKALLHEQILNAAALGVRIVPVVCSGLGESGEYLLRSMALATNGTSFFLTDDSGIGHTHLKPTTDSLKVEHLNDMLVRTIVEFSTMTSCQNDPTDDEEVESDFIPNPFEIKDLENGEVAIPHGDGILYLVDVSGKLLGIYEGEIDNFQMSALNHHLPIGVYFLKAYTGGKWYTKKVLVR